MQKYQSNSSQLALEGVNFEEQSPSIWTKKSFQYGIILLIILLVGAVIATSVCLSGKCGSGSSTEEVTTKCHPTCNDGWGYTETDGPACWADCFEPCKGRQQSPIDLRSGTATPGPSGQPLSLTEGFTEPRDVRLYNNGHTVSVDLMGNYNTSGIGLPGEYMAYQFHFHWGSNSSHGSEHYIDGRKYPLEMHVVHYSMNYSGAGEAITKRRGLAVLGFMFTISPEDNPAYDSLIDSLEQIPYKNDDYMIENVTLIDMFPDMFPDMLDHIYYYRYDGSLTTPNCDEAVYWTVFTNTIEISERQLEKFRSGLYVSSQGETQVPMINTYRPPLPLGDRQLHLYSA